MSARESLFSDTDEKAAEALSRITPFVPLNLYDEVLKPLEQVVGELIRQRDEASGV